MPAETKCWHFGVLSTAGVGHLNPLIALSHELVGRGHQVTFFGRPKIERDIAQAGLGFFPLAPEAIAPPQQQGTTTPSICAEIASLRSRLTRMCGEIEYYLAETPAAIAQTGVNALLVDEIALTGPTIAQLLGLPYFVIATSVPHHFGWKFSSWFSGHRLSKTRWSWLQSIFLEQSVLRISGRVRRTLDRFRHSVGLGPPGGFPCLACITQLPPCLALPGPVASKNWSCAGPFIHRFARLHVPFPWEKLDGRPIVYASLGTTKNVPPAVLRMIAEACRGLGVQLVISLGNRFAPEDFADQPGDPIVVRYAPQLELLKRAAIVITHGGSNTVFESLLEAKPMIVIPLAFDQPAMAARLRQAGVAEVLPVMHLSPRRIRRALVNILEQRKYREAALRIQAELNSISGVECAANILEEALACRRQMPEPHALRARVSSRTIASSSSQ